MGNKDNNVDIFMQLDEVISDFGRAYSNLVNIGGNNEVLDAAIEAYINSVYKNKISEACGIQKEDITLDVVKTIQFGKQDENMISRGKFTMFRRAYSLDEVVDIVENKLHKKIEKSVASLVNEEKPLFNEIKKEEDNGVKEIEVKPNLDLANEIANDVNVSFDKVEVKEEPVNISDSKENVEDVKFSSKLEEVELKVKKLYDEYYSSNEKSDEKYNKIKETEDDLYRSAIAELTGIKKEDIKDFVIAQVSGGINDTKIDENGNSVSYRRALNDDEAKLIVQYTNDMTEEEIDNLLN